MKFCSKCGNQIHDEAVICVHCGCSVESAKKETRTDSNEYNRLMTFVNEAKTIHILGIISIVLCLGIGIIFQIINLVKLKKYPYDKATKSYTCPEFDLADPNDINAYETAKKKIKNGALMTGIGFGISFSLIFFAIWCGVVMPAIL